MAPLILSGKLFGELLNCYNILMLHFQETLLGNSIKLLKI